MSLPVGAVDANHTFYIRRVARNRGNFTLPNPCFRFTGSGDRPCDSEYTPYEFGFKPWKLLTVRPDSVLMYWSWSLADTVNPYVYVDAVPQPFAFHDHSLVEVARYASRTSYVGSDGAGYGIWFWVTPGSGVAVNIGRALRFVHKNDAIAWSREAVTANDVPSCALSGSKSCLIAEDTLFCTAARKQGFDSIISPPKEQMKGTPHVSERPSQILELILCPPTEPPELTTACPPMVPFYTAKGEPCTCNAKAEIATCTEAGDDGRVVLSQDYGNRFVGVASVAAGVYVVPLLGGVAVGAAAVRKWWGRRRSGGKKAPNSAKSPEVHIPLVSCSN